MTPQVASVHHQGSHGYKEDAAETQRRWDVYDREMKALIAAGTVHQDEDGWWVDNATGELIGPDPEIERPLTPKISRECVL